MFVCSIEGGTAWVGWGGFGTALTVLGFVYTVTIVDRVLLSMIWSLYCKRIVVRSFVEFSCRSELTGVKQLKVMIYFCWSVIILFRRFRFLRRVKDLSRASRTLRTKHGRKEWRVSIVQLQIRFQRMFSDHCSYLFFDLTPVFIECFGPSTFEILDARYIEDLRNLWKFG